MMIRQTSAARRHNCLFEQILHQKSTLTSLRLQLNKDNTPNHCAKSKSRNITVWSSNHYPTTPHHWCSFLLYSLIANSLSLFERGNGTIRITVPGPVLPRRQAQKTFFYFPPSQVPLEVMQLENMRGWSKREISERPKLHFRGRCFDPPAIIGSSMSKDARAGSRFLRDEGGGIFLQILANSLHPRLQLKGFRRASRPIGDASNTQLAPYSPKSGANTENQFEYWLAHNSISLLSCWTTSKGGTARWRRRCLRTTS